MPFRQCGLGWHDECSDPQECDCPCHQAVEKLLDAVELASKMIGNGADLVGVREDLEEAARNFRKYFWDVL